MTLLAAKVYDPSTAVSKATSSLLAMTAFDTTNLRLSFSAPSLGNVLVVMRCMLQGATTFPQVLLGVLSGSTVVARGQPTYTIGASAIATTRVTLDATFELTGLSGTQTWDAAYAVQALVASTNIKYGGPNNTTANDAFGAFRFAAYAI